jgi:hypothetical protein
MTDTHDIPSWAEPALVLTLLDGKSEDLLSSLLLGGRLLRFSGLAPSLRRGVREGVARVLRSWDPGSLERLWPLRAQQARDLASEADANLAQRGQVEPALVLSLLLLRDDLESLAQALAAARFVPGVLGQDLAERCDLILCEVQSSARGVDQAALALREGLESSLWAALLEEPPAVQVPPELEDLISPRDNPWWLDLVDPVRIAAARHYFQAAKAPRRMAAATLEPGHSEEVIRFERGAEVRIYRDHAGAWRAKLTGAAWPAEAGPAHLEWIAQEAVEGPEAAREPCHAELLHPYPESPFLEAALPDGSVLGASLVALRCGKDLLLRSDDQDE